MKTDILFLELGCGIKSYKAMITRFYNSNTDICRKTVLENYDILEILERLKNSTSKYAHSASILFDKYSNAEIYKVQEKTKFIFSDIFNKNVKDFIEKNNFTNTEYWIDFLENRYTVLKNVNIDERINMYKSHDNIVAGKLIKKILEEEKNANN